MADFRQIMGMAPAASPAPSSNTAQGPDYRSMVVEVAQRYGIPGDMAERWIKQESGFNPRAVSPKGAKGLAQLMPGTASDLGVRDVFDPAQNIEGGARYLRAQYDRFGNWEHALAAYNAGPEAVQKAGGIPNYPETKQYVRAIMGETPAGADFRAIMGMGAADPQQPPKTLADPAKASPPPQGAEDPLMAPVGDAKPSAKAFIEARDGKLIFADTGQEVPAGQRKVIETLAAGGMLDPSAPMGSAKFPYVRRGSLATLKPGDYYIDTDEKVKRIPGGEMDSSPDMLKAGIARGVADVIQSGGQLLPGSDDSVLLQALQGNQLLYDARLKGNPVAGAGRFTGQIIGTLPAMAGIEAGLAATGAKTALGGLGRFLAGQAGGAGVGGRVLQGASLGARGALEGAEASALVSSANDAPLGEQIGAGAILGGVVGPAAPALAAGGRAVGQMLGGNKLVGAVAPDEQVVRYLQAQNLPVPVNQTLGELTSSPSQQLLENSMLRGGSGPQAERLMQDARAGATEALKSNVPAIQGRIAGRPLEPGEGAAAAQAKLVEMERAANRGVNEAYREARAVGDDAMLANAAGPREAMQETLGSFDPLNSHLSNVVREVERFGEGGAPTARQLFEARERLSALRGSPDNIEAKAAGDAVRGLDGYIQKALDEDLFLGDPKAVDAWRRAIKSRAEYGKLFEGDDLIDKLTATGRHGEGVALKVAPEEAANYILGRSRMGAVGRKDLTRDLERMKTVLGPDSEAWNALRGDVFAHIAKSGRGAVDQTGESTFSGQKFANAWRNFKEDSPQVAQSMFSAEERKLIDDFAEVAQRVTTSVKGGDNPSNSAVAGKVLIKKALDSFWTMIGAGAGSVGGPGTAAVGAGAGRALDALLKDFGAIREATKAISYKPVVGQPKRGAVNKLLDRSTIPAAAVINSNRLQQNDGASPP